MFQDWAPVLKDWAPVLQDWAPVFKDWATVFQDWAPEFQDWAPVFKDWALVKTEGSKLIEEAEGVIKLNQLHRNCILLGSFREGIFREWGFTTNAF